MTGHRPLRAAPLLLIPLLLTGCGCWGGDSGTGSEAQARETTPGEVGAPGVATEDVSSSASTTSSTTDGPDVSGVVIRPGTVHATGGSLFALEARVKNALGQALLVGAGTGLAIEWDSPQTGVFPEGNTTNPVMIKVPAAGASFQVTAKVTRSVGSTQQVTRSTPATIIISPAASTADNSDWVFVEHVPRNPPAAVLIQGAMGGVDRVDWALGVVGSARLAGNLTAAADGDPEPELVVFAKDRETWVQPASSADAKPWDTNKNEHSANPMNPMGQRHVDVRLAHWDTGQFGLVEDQLDLVQDLFNRNRLGITLNRLPTFVHGRVAGGVPLPISGSVSLACDNANNDLAGNTVETGDTLYIMFVPSIQGSRGVACQPWPAWRARVIYISWATLSLSTLAHEIVHVLGLRSPYVDGNGHVDPFDPGFDGSNLMWGFEDLAAARARDLLTLGQIYRMNLFTQSYLNVTMDDPGPDRACDPHLARGPVCPALAADLGG